MMDRTQIKAKDRLPAGKAKIEVGSRLTAPKPGSPIDVTLKVDDNVVARGLVPQMVPVGFTPNDCLDMGVDHGSPVSKD